MRPRHSFGALYGALILNYPSIVISSLQEEFIMHKMQYVRPDEVAEILEALSVNTSVDRSHHNSFIAGYLEPYMIKHWKFQFRYFLKRQLTLVKSLDRLEYYHTGLFYMCIEAYCKLKEYKLQRFHDGINCLHDISQRGVCTNDITENIGLWTKRHKRNAYFMKTYNFDALRNYSYEELKEMRNDKLTSDMVFISPQWQQSPEHLEHLAERYRAEFTAEGIEAAKFKLSYEDEVKFIFLKTNNKIGRNCR